jgi:ribosomal protein L28
MCSSCGKGAKKAAHRSHSNVKVLRRQYPNIQKVNGVELCTKCLRSAAKKMAV